tara:strand:- start:209 stop:502 length:294 start_codon:yes stop_codon:yes gene_type:complete
MALTKEIIEDKIEIVGEHKHVQVRSATIIKEDGVELNRSFNRKILVPSVKNDGSWEDTDISGESSQVQGICNAVWTSDVKTAYQNHKDSTDPTPPSE